ncbi:sodium-coupled monocarboxylate transporter 2-like isoform X2 [Amblyomma americanum]
MRFNAPISLSACAIYILLTQSVGAMSIFAASLTLVTVLKAPLFWCNIIIGLSATIYTALGGLRGVVFTDCMQFLFILIAPTTIIAKILMDSFSSNSTIQPVGDLDAKKYVADYSFDLTRDENIWSYVLGTAALALYRMCMDQMVVQRFLASRTLKDAKRTVVTGTFLLFLVYSVGLLVGVSLTIWYRGCDPGLSGAITSLDQILPYYINNNLVHIPGFVGLFMAGVVSAATSTISSAINSQAAILYVDVISHRHKKAEQHMVLITRVTAIGLGIIMTIYSTVCVYLGSLTRVILMIYSAVTAPFVGLCILAVLFPFVHSKGAGIATLITIVYQLWSLTETILHGQKPERMPVSLDYCPENLTAIHSVSNTSYAAPTFGSQETSFFRLSHLWSSFFAVFVTLIVGVVLSAVTGEMTSKKEQPKLTSDALVRLWRRPGHLPSDAEHRDVKFITIESTHNHNAEDDKLLTNLKKTDC